MSRLMKYFGMDEEVQEAEARKEQIEQIGAARDWISQQGYRDFRRWLDTSMRSAEPAPGDHGGMLYACGVRDGMRKVEDHLDGLESLCSVEAE